jgi:hypothetical protein
MSAHQRPPAAAPAHHPLAVGEETLRTPAPFVAGSAANASARRRPVRRPGSGRLTRRHDCPSSAEQAVGRKACRPNVLWHRQTPSLPPPQQPTLPPPPQTHTPHPHPPPPAPAPLAATAFEAAPIAPRITATTTKGSPPSPAQDSTPPPRNRRPRQPRRPRWSVRSTGPPPSPCNDPPFHNHALILRSPSNHRPRQAALASAAPAAPRGNAPAPPLASPAPPKTAASANGGGPPTRHASSAFSSCLIYAFFASLFHSPHPSLAFFSPTAGCP